MSAKPFPQVLPENVTGLADQLSKAVEELAVAKSAVVNVAASATWKAPQARPAWDAALSARAVDLSGAYTVCDHAANVLRVLGKQLTDLKSEYDAAVKVLGTDPWDAPQADDPKHPPSPASVTAYAARVQNCDDAADSAQLALILASRELAKLSDGVTFPAPPGTPPDYSRIVSSTGAIVPIAPAWGAPQGAVYANGVPIQFTKGQAFESDILSRLGISSEAKQLWRPDPNQKWNFPRVKGGRLYRGTFPDSRLAGILEIKSGTTSICASSVQIQLQQALAQLLGTSWSLIAAASTPVDPALLASAQKSGGGVYSAVPGGSGPNAPFYDRSTGKYVTLQPSGQGGLKATPLTAEETKAIPDDVRTSVQDGANSPVRCGGSSNQPPPPPGIPAWAPSYAQQPVTDSEYTFAWKGSKDGSYQPATPPQLPTGPIVPVVPLPGPLPVPAFPFPAFPFPAFPVPVFP